MMNYAPVLGVNGCQDTFHDASATLILNGSIHGSMEEERFNRIKHSRGIPHLSVRRLLVGSGLSPSDIGAVGFYLDPWLLLRHYFLHPVRAFYPESLGLFQAFPFYLRFLRSAETLRLGLELPPKVKIFNVRHHLCHAAAAYYGSNFEQAAVLVIDGSGERETASYYRGSGTSLVPIGSPMLYPTSLGFFYEGIASHLGLGWIGGAGKMMGLAPFGKPKFYQQLRRWFMLREDGGVHIDLSKMGYYLNHSFFSQSGIDDIGPPRLPEQALTEQHADLAASAQLVFEDVVVHMARCLQKKTGMDSLCYSGGIALNIDANSAILEKAGFKNVYIMPAAYDGGTSIGAGLAAYFRMYPNARRPAPVMRADLGTCYSNDDISSALEKSGLNFRHFDDNELLEYVSHRLAAGAVVGWFTGRMEVGPRALGFRSILAHPGKPGMADYLNAVVKGRETFRPFAPAVPLDAAGEYFDLSAPSPFMLYKFLVKKSYRDRLAAITHVDGSARVQTVTCGENEKFYSLLKRFGQHSGIPVLLNTSFNLGGEPLVETPDQAIQSYLRSGMDILVMENMVVDHGEQPRFHSFAGLPNLATGVIAPGRPASGAAGQERKPDRFEIGESRLEAWIREAVATQGAESFFKRYYSRPALAALDACCSIANAVDPSIIRKIVT